MAPIARREIAPLRLLCLRSIGPNKCSPEISFAPIETRHENDNVKQSDTVENDEMMKKPETDSKYGNGIISPQSSASKLLLALTRRPINSNLRTKTTKSTSSDEHEKKEIVTDISKVPINRLEYGSGASGVRRFANDLDISAPWISARSAANPHSFSKEEERALYQEGPALVIENGNPGLDCLQSYIDSLVDLSRMSDTRLGKYFFMEWKRCVIEGAKSNTKNVKNNELNSSKNSKSTPGKKTTKRRKLNINIKTSEKKQRPKGSLSLFNCASASICTFRSLRDADIGEYLDVLDLSGVHSMTDKIFTNYVAQSCPHIRRLSMKNCRQITGKSLVAIKTGLRKLEAIDIGGSFNINPNDVIDLVKTTKCLNECYASGLGWTDVLLQSLIDSFSGRNVIGLGLGFSQYLTSDGLLRALKSCQNSLQQLALHFCDTCIESNQSLANLGSLLPNLKVLDIRGCNGVNSIIPFMDARSGRLGNDDSEIEQFSDDEINNDPSYGSIRCIFLLARYTNISKNSLEETNAIYPGKFECIIDSSGVGRGVRR